MEKYFRKVLTIVGIDFIILIPNFFIESLYYTYFSFIFLCLSLLISALFLRRLKKKFDDTLTENQWYEQKLLENNNITYKTKKFTELLVNDLPFAIISIDPSNFNLTWYNNHASLFFNITSSTKTLEDLDDRLAKNIRDGLKEFEFKKDKSIYQVYYDDQFSSIAFYDITENYIIKEKYTNRKLALATIKIDYYDELVGSKDIRSRAEIQGTYFSIIAQYANKYNISIQAVSESTFLFIMDRSQLREILKTEFDLLDIIRAEHNKNNVKLTISIGCASYDILYDELYDKMNDALSLAESRGGDQAVIDIEGEELLLIGGTVEAVESRSKVKSRVIAGRIGSYIDEFDKIFILPHDNADTDALGAVVGVLNMVRNHNKKAKAVLENDHIDKTSLAVLDLYKPDYKADFITLEEANELIDENSLVFVVDCNNEGQVIAKDVVGRTKNVVIIDHHRKSGDTFTDCLISYIEPYASSTCELVAEMIHFTEAGTAGLSYEEATIMYSGMIIDTNNFQTRTGSRTFEVASYLRGKGADINFVKLLLRSDYDEVVLMSGLVSSATNYHNFLISASDDILERVTLAKAANRMLDIKDVVASFAIAKQSENNVHISARSMGQVNVQKFMEKLGGGGHLTGAAAVIKDTTVEEVVERIKGIIDKVEVANGNYIIR